MSSTNTANVIERVLNSKTIFNYLFVTKFPITNVPNGCFGFECDILERNVKRNWYKWFRNKLTLQKHGPLFQVSRLWDISQFIFSGMSLYQIKYSGFRNKLTLKTHGPLFIKPWYLNIEQNPVISR